MQKKRDKIILIICAIVFVIALGAMIVKWYTEKQAQDKFESLSGVSTEVETEDGDIYSQLGVENPGKVLDWEKLWEENEDIYAWIYIPDTNIDYPVLQHESDNSYYLNYNLDGSKGYPGCIYTENINNKDFSDNNTVIYGHNMKNGTMFADIHEFKDESFFEEHRYVYIYMPDKTLIYDIFAVYEFSNAHILYSYDCFTADGYQTYLNMIFNDYNNAGNFRDGIEVTKDNRIITLSTCISGQDDKRLLLQAVCIGEGQ